ncbi:Aste57867_16583 [Aphanomyces stellatus]|uniref:Aste57867_16583 protein n=1 Tax=Aphanomyces stellatus TaxID=120398 RepID=A0A485L7D4_9STRA|nr:hypothetical protein As57867_016526 [Aphanomyces stellatus]VFT93354.1 Aste57867_16583 [Aphanomyces stellatus]
MSVSQARSAVRFITIAFSMSSTIEYDETPAIIEYIWCGESVGLELARPASASTPIVYAWASGPIGITFATDYFSKQVIAKRIPKPIASLSAGCILHSVNGTPVKMDNYNEMMVVLQSGQAAGVTQTLEFLPRPSPVSVKSIPPGGVLEQAGVSTDYELVSINNINVVYLTMDQIGRMLVESSKPCHLIFGLLKEDVVAQLAAMAISENDIVRV